MMTPEELFLSYTKEQKNKYFIERRDLIDHDILYEVDGMYSENTYNDLNDFDEIDWLSIFLKIDALAFCCDFLKEESSSYKKFRQYKRNKNGIYLKKQLKRKDSVLENRAKNQLKKVIETLYELKGNTHNINILKKITVQRLPKQQIYFDDINKFTFSLLSEAGFGDKELKKKIVPLLKSLYKSKIF